MLAARIGMTKGIDLRAALLPLLSPIFFAAACDGSGSVGHDSCVGVDRCTAPKAFAAQPRIATTSHRIASLEALAALDTRTLDVEFSQYVPVFERDGDGVLWSIACDAAKKRLVMRAYDGAGAIRDEHEEDIPEPQTLATCELSPMASTGAERVLWLSLGVPACDAPASSDQCGYTSTPSRQAVLAEAVGGPVQWSVDVGSLAVESWGSTDKVWIPGDEPGYWLLVGFDLVKVDATSGEPILRQSVVSDLYGENVYPVYAQWSALAARPGGGVVVAAASDDSRHGTWSQLLAFTPDGSPEVRFEGMLDPQSGVHEVRVDAQDRAVLFMGAATGDLVIDRVTLDDGLYAEPVVLERDSYFDLVPAALTTDAEGAFYFALTTGLRDEPEQVLCRLPLAGELTCKSIGPADYVTRIMPGGDDVLVQFASDDGAATGVRVARYAF